MTITKLIAAVVAALLLAPPVFAQAQLPPLPVQALRWMPCAPADSCGAASMGRSPASAIGAAAGLVIFPLFVFPLARFLPLGNLPDSLAASALGEDRWNAGMGLMSRANPEKWNGFVADYTIVRVTDGELKTCFDSAQKTGKEQRCSITIRPAPAP